MKSITKIKQSSSLWHFFRILKLLVMVSGSFPCSSFTLLLIVERERVERGGGGGLDGGLRLLRPPVKFFRISCSSQSRSNFGIPGHLFTYLWMLYRRMHTATKRSIQIQWDANKWPGILRSSLKSTCVVPCTQAEFCQARRIFSQIAFYTKELKDRAECWQDFQVDIQDKFLLPCERYVGISFAILFTTVVSHRVIMNKHESCTLNW